MRQAVARCFEMVTHCSLICSHSRSAFSVGSTLRERGSTRCIFPSHSGGERDGTRYPVLQFLSFPPSSSVVGEQSISQATRQRRPLLSRPDTCPLSQARTCEATTHLRRCMSLYQTLHIALSLPSHFYFQAVVSTQRSPTKLTLRLTKNDAP